MTGAEQLPGKVNYLLGNCPAQWHRGILTYAKVRYENLYPGVDLVCYGNQEQLEYDFIVAPQADCEAVALKFEGIDRLEINPEGDLVLHVGQEKIYQHKPVIYQLAADGRKKIMGDYVLRDSRTVGFRVGSYDCAKPLVIDPVLTYSSYLGGRNRDTAWAIAVDGGGNAYLAGETLSDLTTLVTPNAFQTNYAGGFLDRGTNLVGGDAFVAKLDPSGANFIYLTYLGGRTDEAAAAIAVDPNGNACIAGYTDSADFPTQNPIQSEIQGTPDGFFGLFPIDVFVAKLDATGSSLLYSTYLGGDGTDNGLAIALDAAGSIYVAGFTRSTNFPVTANALQRFLNTRTNNLGSVFNADAFVAKIDPSQTGVNALIYCTYLGSFGADQANGVAVDSSGNVVVTGVMDLLGQRDVYGTVQNDSFVAKLDPSGSSLLYARLFHGASNDLAFRINLDPAENAYITGSTTSGDFPTTPNGFNQGGVFKSTDGGMNWSLSSAGLTRSYIRSLAFNPTNSAVLYAGTRGGVFTSLDAGGSWFGQGADSLDYVVISNQITITNLYFTNAGARMTNSLLLTNTISPPITFWLSSPNALGFRAVTSIAFDPVNPSTIYAGTAGSGPFSSLNVIQTSVTNVEAAATNAQSDWFAIPGTNGVLINPNVNAFVVDPVLPSYLYAGTSGSLFKSTNYGATWFGAGLGFGLVKALAISSNASVLYAGASAGVARSSNRGTNWTVVNTGLANLDVNALALDPTTPATVYAGTVAGIFKSVNGGTNWVARTNGLTSRFINALAIDPGTPTTIYAGTTNGLFKSLDGGTNWLVMTNGITATNIASLAIDPASPGIIYAGTGSTNTFGTLDCFVTKISPDGTTLPYSTVLGGTGSDQGWDVAVDPAGDAFVTGVTTSTNFPVVQAPSPMQMTNSGGSDAFVFELDPLGASLIYSFYLGGKGEDVAHGIGVDAAGNAYVVGQTASINFPVVNPFRGNNSGNIDMFVTMIGASTAPQPKLFAARAGNNLILSWDASMPEYVLEVNNGVMHPMNWVLVAQTPVVVNGMKTVTVSISGGQQSFRLKRR